MADDKLLKNADPQKDPHELATMPLSEHLDELRGVIIKSLVAAVATAAVCMFFGDRIMSILCIPLATALNFHGLPVSIRTIAPAESFLIYMNACFFGGIFLASPYILHQIWSFIAGGLYPNERKTVLKYFPASVGLFVLGALFFFFVIAPICLGFFVGFYTNYPQPELLSPVLVSRNSDNAQNQNSAETKNFTLPVLDNAPENLADGTAWIDSRDKSIRIAINGEVRTLQSSPQGFLHPEITLANYMGFISSLTLVFALSFEMPLVILLLTRLSIVSTRLLKKLRRHVIVALLLISAIVTPPDIVSQIALTIPLYLLFELGIILARDTGKSRKAGVSQA